MRLASIQQILDDSPVLHLSWLPLTGIGLFLAGILVAVLTGRRYKKLKSAKSTDDVDLRRRQETAEILIGASLVGAALSGVIAAATLPHSDTQKFHDIAAETSQQLTEEYQLRAADPVRDTWLTDSPSWVSRFTGNEVQRPAEVRVVTEQKQRSTYEVLLIDHQVILIRPSRSESAPEPEQLRREDDSHD